MSPAAVDMRSPFTSSTQMQSTQQEGLFTPQSSDPNSCFSFDFGSFPGKFSVPALPGRSKPRLAKTRRHLAGKVKSVPAENKSGFNPSHVATSSTSNGYFFCTNENSLNANSYLEKNQSNGASCNSNSECKESKNNEFGKFLSGGFVFGCENSCSVQSSDLENGEYGEMRESNVFLNSDEVRFEFVATRGDSNSISNLATEESSENIEKLVHDTRGELKVNSEEADNVGLVFGGKWCEPRSNLNRVKSQLNEDWGKSVPIGTQKKKSGAQLGKFDSMGFVFGATPKGSSSTSSFQNEFDHGGEKKVDIELELRKGKTNDIFVFGGSSKKNSSSSDINKLSDEVNKQNTENSRIKINFVDNDIHRSDSVVNNKYNFVFESSFNATCASGLSTAEELSDEMGKLRVDDSKNMCNSADKKTPLHDSCASSDHVFIFGSSKMSSGSFSGQSGITKIKDVNLQGPWSGRSGVGVSDEQIKLGCLFETCEEKWPCNVNERSSDDPSVGISTPKSFTFQAGPSKTSGRRQGQVSNNSILKKFFDQSLFSSGICDLEVPFLGRVESKDNLSFTSKPAEVGACAADLRTPNWDASSSFAANLVTGFSKNAEYSERNRSIRNKRWKKRGGKLRQVDQVQQKPSKNNEGSQQNLESPGCYSPMDFSPYQDDHCAPSINATSSGFAKDEALATAKGVDTSRGEENRRQPNEEFSKNFYERFGAETECRSFKPEQICTSNDDGADGTADAAISNSKGEENECRSQFCFASRTEDNLRNFNFCATSAEDNVSAAKCRNRKKYRLRVGHGTNSVTPMHKVDTASSSVQFPLPDSNYLHVNQAQDKERDIVNSQMKVENNLERDGKHSKQSTAAIKKVCQKWRIRGNLAYEKGSLSKAEEFYTKGINSFPHTGSPGCCIEPLVLCYSNRAAARMSCGRMREALGDCVMAATLDPDFHKVQIRAANCHLALGEVEEARQYFSKCLDTNGDVCLDRRIAIEAASGLQNAQKVAECMHHCAELLRQRTSTAANSALEIMSAVLPTSSYSENLLELKGEALLMLRRYKEVIQLCEQTLVFAEKNFAMVASDNNLVNVDGPKSKNSTIRLWRLRLMSKSYFHLGRLELALDLLEKQEFLRSAEDRSNSEDLSMPFVATVRELLLHKNAGNEAFQSGRHMEAVEHYSATLSSSIESRPFAAICFCNRAAAHQALGQLSDAISDCSTAIALDGSYSKCWDCLVPAFIADTVVPSVDQAVSRRATLHERIRDFENATSDLQILISLLDEQFQGSASSSDRPSGSNVEELRQARCRLSSVEGKANRGLPLDHYLILGVKSSDTGSEIKKAYRRAALRHHPDKAGQFLARSESGDDGELWKEISEKVQKDADRLFKMIGEAYAVLSDPTKRSQYDLEEELRNVQGSNTNRASKGPSDFYSTPFKSRRNGRYGQESWRTYGNSHSQW